MVEGGGEGVCGGGGEGGRGGGERRLRRGRGDGDGGIGLNRGRVWGAGVVERRGALDTEGHRAADDLWLENY